MDLEQLSSDRNRIGCYFGIEDHAGQGGFKWRGKRVSFQLVDERRELRFEGRKQGGGGGIVVCVRACLCDLFTSGASVVGGGEVAVISVSELRVPISVWTNRGTRWTRFVEMLRW